MPSHSIKFPNGRGQELAARLELPADERARFYALFAHCFTCNKSLTAVRNISRALNQRGIAVLRFDFTGLGDSEGAFADTNFSSNILDLEAAAAWLASEYEAPRLLVGHSLGGAAVLHAAPRLSSVQAIATIGAPADADHITHLFHEDLEAIDSDGEAEADIGGRPFKIKKQFLEDIRSQNMQAVLKDLRKALLFLHSPQDAIVGIENAAQLYQAAFHPKSFVSLDGADHLLSKTADSQYAGDVIASWAERYIETEVDDSLTTEHQTAVRVGRKGFTADIVADHHYLLADEPESVGGADLGPTPYDLLLASLGACTAMTLRMYADRKKWPLEQVTVHLNHRREHRSDMAEDMEKGKTHLDFLERLLELEGDLSEEQRERLLDIANRCPVHRTLENSPIIETDLLPDLKASGGASPEAEGA